MKKKNRKKEYFISFQRRKTKTKPKTKKLIFECFFDFLHDIKALFVAIRLSNHLKKKKIK